MKVTLEGDAKEIAALIGIRRLEESKPQSQDAASKLELSAEEVAALMKELADSPWQKVFEEISKQLIFGTPLLTYRTYESESTEVKPSTISGILRKIADQIDNGNLDLLRGEYFASKKFNNQRT